MPGPCEKSALDPEYLYFNAITSERKRHTIIRKQYLSHIPAFSCAKRKIKFWLKLQVLRIKFPNDTSDNCYVPLVIWNIQTAKIRAMIVGRLCSIRVKNKKREKSPITAKLGFAIFSLGRHLTSYLSRFFCHLPWPTPIFLVNWPWPTKNSSFRVIYLGRHRHDISWL